MTTFRLEAVHPIIEGAPGLVLGAPVVIHNDSTQDATFSIAVVGLQAAAAAQPPALEIRVGARSSVPCEIPVAIPATLGLGQHAAAFEMSSDRLDDRPILQPFSIAIASVHEVVLTPTPTTVRARRRARLDIDIVNNEPNPVAIRLDGSAPDVRVRFPDMVLSLQPGQVARMRARLRGPTHWFGEHTQHNVLVTARGTASATSINVPYVQRPLFAYRIRMLTAAVAVIALFCGAAFVAVNLWDGRNDTSESASIDADGDGILDPALDADGNPIPGTGGTPAGVGSGVDADGDGFFDPALDADGNPIPGTGGASTGGLGLGIGSGVDADGDGFFDPALDANGNPVPGTGGASTAGTPAGSGVPGVGGAGDPNAPGTPGAGPTAARRKNTAIIRGTISAQNTGSIDGISIKLVPISLGEEPSPGAVAFSSGATAADPPSTTKIWSARGAVATRPLNSIRQTEPLRPRDAKIEDNGVWLFSDVALRQSYEVVFSKAGFDTQTFVLTPPDSGDAIELDVVLVPAVGQIGGRVSTGGSGLGGVSVKISDGTLVFGTTSSTEADRGAFNLDGLSTPGVYTVVASRRGYGTVVQQVRLEAGARQLDVAVAMRPNVGSISGRATGPEGNALAGVTIAATDGEIVRSTTSLTDGDTGFYSLPQLDNSGSYTVTASLEGYLTQTRRLSVNGNVGGINFRMVPETLTLTGNITDPNGVGITNAGVTLTRDDLQFRVSTDAGAFNIDDLPPGEYRIEVKHFKHVTVNEVRTIVAGVRPDPLNIQLEAKPDGPGVGTGILSVRIRDPQAAEGDGPLIGATIVLTGTSATGTNADGSAKPRFSLTVGPTTVASTVLPPVPLGTYTLEVSHPGYNTPQPRQVSVGSNGAVEVYDLFRKGDASGTLVDALNNNIVLSNYSISLAEVLSDGEIRERFSIPARFDTWETGPDQLVFGTWQASVPPNGGPDGYIGGAPQRFEISQELFEQVVVPPLEAFPYPNIGGRILQPTLVNGAVRFVALDEPSLGVTVTCTSSPTGPYTVTADQLSDTFGATDGTKLDTFYIPKEIVDQGDDGQGLIGDCTFTVTADGYETRTAALTDIVISDGVKNTDRFVNIAMSKEIGTFGGNLFWTDQGATTPADAQVFLPGVPITAAQAVVNFGESDNPTAPGVDPTVIPLDITATTSATPGDPVDGLWAFESLPTFRDQIFGVATYTFAAPGFDESSITLTVDENGQRITGQVGTRVVDLAVLAQLDVELTDLQPTDLTGTVKIITSDLPADFSILQPGTGAPPSGTPPVGAPIDLSPTHTAALDTPTSQSAALLLGAVKAGTWTVDFPDIATHEYRNPTDLTQAGTPTFQQRERIWPGVGVWPGIAQREFDATLVELGRADFTVTAGGADVTAQTTVTVIDAPPGATNRVTSARNGNILSVVGIPVDTGPTPAVTAVQRGFRINVMGHDPTTAVVFDGQNNLVNHTVQSGAIVLPSTAFVAGTKQSYRMTIEPYGTLVAKVEVERAPGAREALPLPPAGRPVIEAVRKLDLGLVPVNDAVGPSITGAADGTFTVSGPPGFYEITFDAPGFAPDPISGPTADASGYFEIRNVSVPRDISATPFVLSIVKGALDITAVTELTNGVAVDTAWYVLRAESTGPVLREGRVMSPGSTNNVIVPGLFPASYWLEIRSYTDPVGRMGENAFPTMVNVTVDSLDAVTPQPNTVVAPLPPVAASLIGQVRAENSRRLRMPLPLTVEISANFDVPPDASVDDVLSDNLAPTLSMDTIEVDATMPDQPAYRYVFAGVPAGNHTLAAPTIADYRPPTVESLPISPLNPVTVGSAGTTDGPTFVYEVPDTTVVVLLNPGAPEFYDPEEFSAVLTAPTPNANGTSYTYDPTLLDLENGRIEFGGVAPEIGGFSLIIDSLLHEEEELLGITVGVGDVADVPFTMIADMGRVTGTVLRKDGPGEPGLFTSGDPNVPVTDPTHGTAQLTRNGVVKTIEITDGTFSADVTEGTWNLKVTRFGYQDSPSIPIIVTAGRINEAFEPDQPLVMRKLGKFQIVLNNADDVANGTLRLVSLDVGNPSVDAIEDNNDPTLFTRDLPAGDYNLEFSGDDYPTVRLPGTVTITTGVTNDSGTTELPRQLTVSVAGATARTTVRITGGGGSKTLEPTGNGVLVFRSDDVSAALPVADAYTIRISSPRSITVERPIPAYAAGGSLGRTETVNFVAAPVVNLTGAINFTGGGAIDTQPTDMALTATSPNDVGPPTVIHATISVSATGVAYVLPGLTSTPDGASRTWALSIERNGVVVGTDSVDIDAPYSGATTKNLESTPVDIDIDFALTSTDGAGGGASLEDSIVTITGFPPSDAVTGTATTATVTVTVPENYPGGTDVVSVAGSPLHDPATASLGSFPWSAPIPITLTVT